MNEFAIPHSVSGIIAGVQRGTGEWPFLTDMFDDNDIFAHAESQQQVPTKTNPKAAIPLPVTLIQESLEIDETAPSGLKWNVRPRHHFATKRGWRTWNARYAGRHAGARLVDTIYFNIEINNAPYRSHRIIYLLAHGVDPGMNHVDHINPSLSFPNVAANLRIATNGENMRNQKKRSDNSSGHSGVVWNRNAWKWQSRITVNGKVIWLGLFTELANAVAARKAAEMRYFGEYAFDASRNRIPVTEQP